jgi:hypothetical protein
MAGTSEENKKIISKLSSRPEFVKKELPKLMVAPIYHKVLWLAALYGQELRKIVLDMAKLPEEVVSKLDAIFKYIQIDVRDRERMSYASEMLKQLIEELGAKEENFKKEQGSQIFDECVGDEVKNEGACDVEMDALGDSGKMKVVDYTTKNRKIKHLKVEKRPHDEGMIPRYMGRYCSDRRIFSDVRRRKLHGGTMLIDVSGSMHVDQKVLSDLVNKVRCDVALYSGDNDSLIRGEVAIVAKGNRIVSELPNRGNGNVVDYPALLWLLKQPTPHYWVCDGMVTGKEDKEYISITSACNHLKKTHNIEQFLSMDDAVEALNKRKNL